MQSFDSCPRLMDCARYSTSNAAHQSRASQPVQKLSDVNPSMTPCAMSFKLSRTRRQVYSPLAIHHTHRTVQNTTNAEKFGSSVFSHDDQYRKLVQFKNILLDTHGVLPRLYVVSIDISKSYDTIKQNKLYSLVQQLFQQEEYLVQQMKRTQIKPHCATTRHQYVVHASGLGSFPQFSKQAAVMAQSLRNAIFSDVVNYDYEETNSLLQLLHQHIFQNIVKV